MKKIFLIILLSMPFAASAVDLGTVSVDFNANYQELLQDRGSYYDWGRAVNGYGYCYEWTWDRQVLNGGQPVNNFLCESYRSSRHSWGRAVNGYGYCYQYTPYGDVMNMGQPQDNFLCERTAPSYYSWGRGANGNTYCYQYTANGFVMNQGQPVDNFYCR